MLFGFLFDSVGFGEWFVLLAVVLIVVGPRNLPSTARKLGNYYSKFRRAAESFKRQIMEMDTEFDKVVADAEKETEKAMGPDPFASESDSTASKSDSSKSESDPYVD